MAAKKIAAAAPRKSKSALTNNEARGEAAAWKLLIFTNIRCGLFLFLGKILAFIENIVKL